MGSDRGILIDNATSARGILGLMLPRGHQVQPKGRRPEGGGGIITKLYCWADFSESYYGQTTFCNLNFLLFLDFADRAIFSRMALLGADRAIFSRMALSAKFREGHSGKNGPGLLVKSAQLYNFAKNRSVLSLNSTYHRVNMLAQFLVFKSNLI